jgi:hypothetical protein
MGKLSIDPFEVRQSFSHARTKPLVVEKVKRRSAASTVLLCPSCGARMKVVREPKFRRRVRTVLGSLRRTTSSAALERGAGVRVSAH